MCNFFNFKWFQIGWRGSLFIGLVFLCTLALSQQGCGQSANDAKGDEFDDSLLSMNKADTGGIVDGSLESTAVLKVANESCLTDLEDPSKVGLSLMAAKNIVATRMGDDGLAGTSDDTVFSSLKQLDEIPYIGPQAFQKMLAYAKAMGFIPKPPIISETDDPFTPASCQGPAMTFEEGLKYFSPASQKSHTFLKYDLLLYRQRCNDHTGCTPWVKLNDEIWSYYRPWYMSKRGKNELLGKGNLSLPSTEKIMNLSLQITESQDSDPDWHISMGAADIRAPIKASLFAYLLPGNYGQPPLDLPGYEMFSLFTFSGEKQDPNSWIQTRKGVRFDLSGNLTNHCIRLETEKSTSADGNTTTYRIVLFAKF